MILNQETKSRENKHDDFFNLLRELLRKFNSLKKILLKCKKILIK